ncbi:CPBP family intramembrane glutamic endopeptidase [Sanguibacter sp. A247]|uniref:CPBP family intramembrane glutamic endopeptidase n=1 Tax=unclassified Sanguibacter TaxID=2645534 RepID=UPI003FD81CC4
MSTDAAPTTPPRPDRATRLRLGVEIWIVLGLSLGRSAIYAIANIIERLSADTALKDQAASINTSLSPRPWVDLAYQLLSIGFTLVPVALALYLLSSPGRSALARLGLDRARPLRDLGWGVALAAAIGLPGLGFYALGRAAGITVQVQPANLDAYWWTVPVLILHALKNALLEEIIVVGYLMERLREMRWSLPAMIIASSVLRGSYHLYQGIGPFFGNVVMGIVFCLFYVSRWGRRRTMPLVVAHTILDIVSFVGWALLPAIVLGALGVL